MDNSFQRRFEDAVKSRFTGLTGVNLFNSIDGDTQVFPCLVFELGGLEDKSNIGCYVGKLTINVKTSADPGDSDQPELRHGDLVDSVGEIIFGSGFLLGVQTYDSALIVYRCEPCGASQVRPSDTHFETAHELDVAFTPA